MVCFHSGSNSLLVSVAPHGSSSHGGLGRAQGWGCPRGEVAEGPRPQRSPGGRGASSGGGGRTPLAGPSP